MADVVWKAAILLSCIVTLAAVLLAAIGLHLTIGEQ